mgnify:CR=1 FL=1
MAKQLRDQTVQKGRLHSYHPIFDRALFVLALLGVIVTVHLIIQQGRGFDRGCLGFSAPTGAAADCNLVVQSDAGKLFGISNAVWGLGYYLVLAAIGAAVAFASGRTVQQLKQGRAALIVFGLLYSLYLVYVQYFQIGEFCVLCLTSASIVTLLFIVQAVEFMQTSIPERVAAQPRNLAREATLIASLAVVVLVLVGADVMYFNSLEEAQTPVAASVEGTQPAAVAAETGTAECMYDPEKPVIANYKDAIAFGDPMKGNPQAPVTVIEVFEPNCPHCKTLHPIMSEVVEKYGDKASFYFKPVVFWQQSVLQAIALQAAAQEGKFFEMLELQFAAQDPRTGLDLPQLEQMANQIGMNGEAMGQRIKAQMYNSIVERRNAMLMETFGIRSVPVVLINGRTVHSASRTVECIGQLIEQAAQG